MLKASLLLFVPALMAFGAEPCPDGELPLQPAVNATLPRLRELVQAWPGKRIGMAMYWNNVVDHDGKGFCDREAYGNLTAWQADVSQDKNALQWIGLNYKARDVWDQNKLGRADAWVEWCDAHNVSVYGHAFVWGAHCPSWFNASLTRDEGLSALRDVMSFMFERWPKVWSWNVVMEPFGDPHWKQPVLKNNSFMQVLGEDYIDTIFLLAHELNPAPKRCLLDYKLALGMYPNMQGSAWDSSKANVTFNYVSGMRSRDVPVNCVAMEGHIAPKDVAGPEHRVWLTYNMERYAALGVDVHLNAVTVDITNFPADWDAETRLEAQAGWYRTLLGACLDSSACKLFESYGLTDKYDMGPNISSLPFDADYEPKPAFWAMLDELTTVDRSLTIV